MSKLPKPNSVIMAVHDYHWGDNRVHRETSRAVVNENGAMSYDFWNGSGGIQPEHLISWEYIEHSKIEELEERIQQLTDAARRVTQNQQYFNDEEVVVSSDAVDALAALLKENDNG